MTQILKGFGKNLHEEVSGEESGDLGRIFKSISSGNRDDSTYSDQHLANKEAQELYDVTTNIFTNIKFFLFKVFYLNSRPVKAQQELVYICSQYLDFSQLKC